MISRTLILCLLCAVVFSSGCVGRWMRSSQISAVRGPAPGASSSSGASANFAAQDSDYRLAPRDQVDFAMFNEPDLATTQRLSTSGEMTLPLIGTVNIAGRTLREAEKEVRQRYLEGGYFVNPHVMLSVSEYGAHFVTILGQVNRPDRIEMPIEASTIGLVAAITQAGGFTRLARDDAVQVTRQTATGAERHITIDVREFLGRRGSGGADEFQLQPGDVVFVPERLF